MSFATLFYQMVAGVPVSLVRLVLEAISQTLYNTYAAQASFSLHNNGSNRMIAPGLKTDISGHACLRLDSLHLKWLASLVSSFTIRLWL